MSIKKLLFIAMSDHLEATLQHYDGVPSIQWVDKDLGQFEMLDEGVISMPFPSVLISFPDTDYESTLGDDQTGEGALRIRIGFENYYDASNGSPNREAALLFFDFNERVHNAVTSFRMEQISGIKRIGEAEDMNHKNVIVTEIMYQYTLYDKGEDTNTYIGSEEYPNASPKPRFSEPPEPPQLQPMFIIP